MGLYSGGLIIGRIFAAEIFGGLFLGGLIIGILRYFVLGYFEEREIGYDCSEARGVFLLYPVGVGGGRVREIEFWASHTTKISRDGCPISLVHKWDLGEGGKGDERSGGEGRIQQPEPLLPL